MHCIEMDNYEKGTVGVKTAAKYIIILKINSSKILMLWHLYIFRIMAVGKKFMKNGIFTMQELLFSLTLHNECDVV